MQQLFDTSSIDVFGFVSDILAQKTINFFGYQSGAAGICTEKYADFAHKSPVITFAGQGFAVVSESSKFQTIIFNYSFVIYFNDIWLSTYSILVVISTDLQQLLSCLVGLLHPGYDALRSVQWLASLKSNLK